MNYYKLIISYDGTDFQGWQEQPNGLAVTNILKKTFKSVFQEEISLIGASRTDAGVHAFSQVARIKTNLLLEPENLLNAWNNILPETILIKSLVKTGIDFHPMKNVKQKTYFYHFFQEQPLPFCSRYGWHFRWAIDLKKLKECLKIFIGTHDFRSFSTGYEMETTIKTIDSINLEYIKEINAYRIIIKGQSFLHHMIRRIVGACLEVSSRPKIPPEHLIKVLKEKDPEQSLPNADAKGLMLYNIEYE